MLFFVNDVTFGAFKKAISVEVAVSVPSRTFTASFRPWKNQHGLGVKAILSGWIVRVYVSIRLDHHEELK